MVTSSTGAKRSVQLCSAIISPTKMLRLNLSPGVSLALRRTDVAFPPSLLATPLSVFESADPDEVLELVLGDNVVNADTYAATLWPSAYVAASTLLRELTRRPIGAAVTELGCGPGLPSLAALAAGAGAVTATDHSPMALAFVSRSVSEFLPDRAERLHTALLDVLDPRAMPLSHPCDLLVAADLLYDEATAEALGERVARQVACGTTAIVTEPGRQKGLGRAAFLRGVRASGLLEDGGRFRFVEEPVPRRWCGREEPCSSVGVCVLERCE